MVSNGHLPSDFGDHKFEIYLQEEDAVMWKAIPRSMHSNMERGMKPLSLKQHLESVSIHDAGSRSRRHGGQQKNPYDMFLRGFIECCKRQKNQTMLCIFELYERRKCTKDSKNPWSDFCNTINHLGGSVLAITLPPHSNQNISYKQIECALSEKCEADFLGEWTES